MSTVFLDTVGLIALWDRRDQWHPAAEKAFASLVADRAIFLTTSFVLLECGNASARRPYRNSVERLRNQLEGHGLIVHPTADDWKEGWAAYGRGNGDQAGIVDQISFIIMRRLSIFQGL